jgi:integrase/recombinase XerD
MLGHSQIATTQIYTRVAIGKLKEIHERTFVFAYQKPDFVLEPVKAPKRKTVKQPTAAVKDQNINVLPFENSLEKSVKDYLDYLKIKNFSIKTILNKKSYLKRFLNWLKDEMVESFQEVTRETLQNYQKHTATILAEGKPLSHASRLYMISEVALFFAYLSKQGRISINPAASLSMPKRIKSLPMDILSKDEIESIFAQPDLKTPAGLRDRAILELFYSTGMRLSELCHLKISDIDFEQNSVFIKGGKFKKDRYIPAGLRALFWVREYLEKARVHQVQSTDEGYLFLNRWGGHHSEGLNQQVKSYMKKAGIKKAGSTILFRHSMATHMMDNDADLRYIQSILGHESLETTKIYTHVAIGKLKEVHAKTHPAEKNSRQADSLEEY